MTAIVEQVLDSIRSLRKEELEIVMAEVKERLRRQRQMEIALNAFVGAGEGLWTLDAQEYVNDLRSGDTMY